MKIIMKNSTGANANLSRSLMQQNATGTTQRQNSPEDAGENQRLTTPASPAASPAPAERSARKHSPLDPTSTSQPLPDICRDSGRRSQFALVEDSAGSRPRSGSCAAPIHPRR